MNIEDNPIANYRLGEQLGVGGMGRVLKAHDQVLQRDVALKVLRPELVEDQGSLERFRAEARHAGQLDHPNIIPVHDYGEDSLGHPYFTMKLVQGESLEAIIERLSKGDPQTQHHFSFQRRAQLAQEICRAVAYAHSRGVLHRDLKPANVMVGPFGEVLVVDWGMAEHEETALDDGQFHGSFHFAAPEYVMGGPATQASEVYSLGAILYQLFGLRTPHQGESISQLLTSLTTQEPPDLGSLTNPGQSRVPREIANLVARALSRQPQDRFESASELEGALQEYLDGQAPVVCVATGMKRGANRLARFIDNSPVLAAMLASACVAVPVAEAAVIWALW